MALKSIAKKINDFYNDEFVSNKFSLIDHYKYDKTLNDGYYSIYGIFDDLNLEFIIYFPTDYPFMLTKILVLSDIKSKYIFNGYFCAN